MMIVAGERVAGDGLLVCARHAPGRSENIYVVVSGVDYVDAEVSDIESVFVFNFLSEPVSDSIWLLVVRVTGSNTRVELLNHGVAAADTSCLFDCGPSEDFSFVVVLIKYSQAIVLSKANLVHFRVC